MAKYEGRYENLEHIGVEHGLCEWIETLTRLSGDTTTKGIMKPSMMNTTDSGEGSGR